MDRPHVGYAAVRAALPTWAVEADAGLPAPVPGSLAGACNFPIGFAFGRWTDFKTTHPHEPLLLARIQFAANLTCWLTGACTGTATSPASMPRTTRRAAPPARV